MFLPPCFVLSLMVGFLGIVAGVGSWWFLFAILAGYFTLAVIAAAKICMKQGWKFFLIMPVVFAVMHISYGTGFLTGVATACFVSLVRKGAREIC